MIPQHRRVVVTGMGAVTPLGLTVEQTWANLVAGLSGMCPISYFDAADYPVKVAAEVKGFDPSQYMERKTADRSGKFSQFAIAAARIAVTSARLDMSREEAHRVGVAVANGIDIDSIDKEGAVLRSRGPRRISPLFITRVGPQMPAVQIGLMLGARGPNSMVNSACASGNDALATALGHICQGHADVMVSGGADACISPLAIAGMGILGALSREPDPARACRPFDLNRNGFVFGEGAAILVLESYEHAVRRNAPILAELAGAAWSFDAFNESAPQAEVQAIAMRGALQDAGMRPDEINLVMAHGTGTRLNDAAETKALKLVFGEAAYRLPVTAVKSMLGHAATAAGAMAAVASIMSLRTGVIPPTIKYETPDPECDLDYVPNVSRQARLNACLSNAFGLGGQNCCVIFRRVEGW